MENNIESIKIAKQGGWVILYDEVGYQGNSLYIMFDIKLKDLNVYNWGDRVSSVKTHEYQPTIDEYKQLP